MKKVSLRDHDAVCMSTSAFLILNQLSDFHVNSYWRYVTGGYPKLSNVL
jgi:hypothetical protein